MPTDPSHQSKEKDILPSQKILSHASGERDRLAWALQRGWLKPSNSRRLTVYVIETRKGLPLKIRIRDWILMTSAWVGWGLLLIDAAFNHPSESDQTTGPGYWSSDMVQELIFSQIIVASLVLLLVLFGLHSLYRFRNPLRTTHEPIPLSDHEQAGVYELSDEALKEWRMAKEVKVDLDTNGRMTHYEIYPQGAPDDCIL